MPWEASIENALKEQFGSNIEKIVEAARSSSHDLLAIAQTVLFVYSFDNNSLILIDLQKSSSSPSTKVFQLDKFKKTPFHTLSINISLSHAALISDETVFIIELPSLISSPNILPCTEIGQIWMPARSKILEAKWHPLSSNHILLLLSDDSLCLFDIFSPDRPELLLSCSPSHSSSKYGLQTASRASSFTYGTENPASVWDIFTVYVIYGNGEVYAFCPVLPKNTPVEVSKLKFLREASTNSEQIRWLDTLLNNVDSSSQSFIQCSPPSTFTLPSRIGPLVSHPDTLMETNMATWKAITLNSFPSALVFAEEAGNVYICLSVSVNPQWNIDDKGKEKKAKEKKKHAQLYVLEVVDLNFSKPSQSISLCADPIHKNVFYIHHVYGVHKVNIAWLDKLKDFYNESGDTPPTLSELNSTVDSLIYTGHIDSPDSESWPILGLALTTHVSLGYTMILLTSDGKLSTRPLFHSPSPISIVPKKPQVGKVQSIHALDPNFENTVSLAFHKDPVIPVILTKSGDGKAIKDAPVVLKQLAEIRRVLLEELGGNLMTTSFSLETALKAIHDSCEQQKQHLQKLENEKKNLNLNNEKLLKRLNDVIKTFNSQFERLSAVMMKLESRCMNESEEERQFNSKIRQMDAYVHSTLTVGEKRLLEKLQKLEKKLKEKKSTSHIHSTSLPETYYNLDEIKLSQHTARIDAVDAEVEAALEKIQKIKL